MISKMRFVVRKKGQGGFCDIAGNDVQRPVVYLVPVAYFRETIAGNLLPGLTTHSFDDYTGQHYAVNCELGAVGGRFGYSFSTGNPTSW